MKYVVAIIRPHKFEAVREALDAVGVEDLIVVEIKRYGHDSDHQEFYRGEEYDVNFLPKIKIEFAVSDELAHQAATALREAADERFSLTMRLVIGLGYWVVFVLTLVGQPGRRR